MELLINDLSFDGQCQNLDEAIESINLISDTVFHSKEMRNNTPVKRTRNLKNTQLMKGKSIADFLQVLRESENPRHHDVLLKVIENLMKGPFFDDSQYDVEFDAVKDPANKCIKNTAIHAVISQGNSGIPGLVSFSGSQVYSSHEVIISTKKHDYLFINLFSPDCCNYFKRVYEANPKHKLKESKVVYGKEHTKMDLDDALAQSVLNEGVLVRDKNVIFSYFNGQWYQYPEHIKGCFHGFPIGNPKNNSDLNLVLKEFGKPPFQNNGYKII